MLSISNEMIRHSPHAFYGDPVRTVSNQSRPPVRAFFVGLVGRSGRRTVCLLDGLDMDDYY